MEGSASGLILRYYPGIFLKGLRKIMKKPSQDSRSRRQDLNLGPTEYEAEVLSTRQRRCRTFLGKTKQICTLND